MKHKSLKSVWGQKGSSLILHFQCLSPISFGDVNFYIYVYNLTTLHKEPDAFKLNFPFSKFIYKLYFHFSKSTCWWAHLIDIGTTMKKTPYFVLLISHIIHFSWTFQCTKRISRAFMSSGFVTFYLSIIAFLIICLAVTFFLNTWIILLYCLLNSKHVCTNYFFGYFSVLFPSGIGPRLKVINSFTAQVKTTFSETTVVSPCDFLSPEWVSLARMKE